MSKPTALVVAAVVLLTTISGFAGAVSVATDGGPGVGEAGEVSTATETAGQTTTGVHGLDSGETYWSGERLQFDTGRILDDGGGVSGDARTFELWRVADDGRLSQRVRTFTVDEDGTHDLETGGLTGRYAVRYGERIVYVQDGVGYLEAPPDGSRVTVDASAFEVERQTLSFSWSDPTVYPGQAVTLTVESNRVDYAVAVSGANLSYRDLTEVFPRTAYAEDHDARAGDDVLLLRAGATTDLRLDTTDLRPGERALEFDVVDTATVQTAELSVEEPDEDRRFVSIERREDVGDVVEANVSCSHCFLVVGGPEQGLLDVVELTDTNGDGYVALDVNTRYVGMSTGAPGYPNNVEAYSTPGGDSVDRYAPSRTLEALDEALVYSYTILSDLRSQQGLNPSGRSRPVGAGEIELTLSGSDYVIDRSAYGDREPLGGQVVVRDEADVRTVVLEPRRLEGVETMAAPGGARLPANVEDLRSSVGPRDSVALGDHLVFRFDVPGLFGYLAAEGADVAAVQNNREEGIDLTLEGLADDGRATESYRLDRAALAIYSDPSTDSLYVAVQTGGTSRINLQDGRYRATLTLTGVDGKYDAYSTVDAHDGNPYLAPGETETVSGTATLKPPTATIESPAEGSTPRLNADLQLVVRGTASVAPGNELDLEATATDYAWDTSTTATVNETGYWTVALPLDDAPGEEFTVTVAKGETRFAERTYTVRPPISNTSDPSNGGNASGDDGQSDADESGEPLEGNADDGLLSSLPGLSGLAVPVGGGVGTLVAIWAGWRLVIRRFLL